MKKTLIALAFIAAGSAAAPSFAQSSNGTNGWFVNGNVGRSDVNKGRYDGHDIGYLVNGGYRWTATPWAQLGVEAGYADLGNIHAKAASRGGPVIERSKSDLKGWTAGVNGHFNITPQWYVSGRAGLFAYQANGVAKYDQLRDEKDKTSWYAGVGVGYDITSNVSVGINYDHYDAQKGSLNLSTNLASVSAEYRF